MKCNLKTPIFIAGALIVTAIVASVIVIALENSVFGLSLNYSLGKIGSWGDFLGGVLNPILSFLALIALLWTIKYQVEELTLTRKEVENSTSELRGSREANEQLVSVTQQQNLENSFYQLFDFFNSMVENIGFRDNFGTASAKFHVGANGFRAISEDILSCASNTCSELPANFDRNINPDNWPVENWMEYKKNFESDYEALEALALLHYKHVYSQHQAELGRYFRVLYNILRFLSNKQGEFANGMGETYAKLFRACLSNYELLVIYLNCLSDEGEPMIRYAEEFSLFDNLPAHLLSFPVRESYGNVLHNMTFAALHHKFSPSAFGDNYQGYVDAKV